MVGCIPATAILNGANAQGSGNASTITNPKIFESSIAFADAAARPAAAAKELNTISSRAIKDFKNTFKDATEAQWTKISDGYVAFFKLHGIVNRTYYDKRGAWHFTISYYTEEHLPRDVRAVVKREYYDYSISDVQEIRIEDKVIYLVHVQDDKTLKTLRVTEDGMEVIQELNKQ